MVPMTEEDPGSGHLVALEADDGDLLWNTRIGNILNARQTYLVDGRQHALFTPGGARDADLRKPG